MIKSCLTYIDNIIIDGRFGFQRISQVIEEYTGYDHLRVSYFSAIVAGLVGVLILIGMYEPGRWWFFSLGIWMSAFTFYIFWLVAEIEDVKIHQKMYRPNSHRQVRDFMYVRLLVLFVTVLFIGAGVIYVWLLRSGPPDQLLVLAKVCLITLVSSMYFLACEKAPPERHVVNA